MFSEIPTQGQFLPGLGWEFMIFSKAREGQGQFPPQRQFLLTKSSAVDGWGGGMGAEAKSMAHPDTGCHCPK